MAERYQNVIQSKRYEYPFPTASAGQHGYVSINVSDLVGKKIIGVNLSSTHPAITQGLQLTGTYEGQSSEMYINYYAPIAFSHETHKIIANISYE